MTFWYKNWKFESKALEGGYDTYKNLQNFEANNVSGSSIGLDP